MKTCSKCRESKPLDEFGKSGQAYCRPCQSEYGKRWRAANPDYMRRWLEEHPGYHQQPERLEYARDWGRERRERQQRLDWRWHMREQRKRWREDNPDYVAMLNRQANAAQKRKWRAANPERHLASKRAQRAANIDRYRANDRAWRAANPERRRATRHARRVRQACGVSQRWQVVECDPLACYWCGRGLLGADPHVDHVMPISLGGPAVPSNEVMTCATCNLRKSAKHPLVWIAELTA